MSTASPRIRARRRTRRKVAPARSNQAKVVAARKKKGREENGLFSFRFHRRNVTMLKTKYQIIWNETSSIHKIQLYIRLSRDLVTSREKAVSTCDGTVFEKQRPNLTTGVFLLRHRNLMTHGSPTPNDDADERLQRLFSSNAAPPPSSNNRVHSRHEFVFSGCLWRDDEMNQTRRGARSGAEENV